jgi:streptomycin 6-kinase
MQEHRSKDLPQKFTRTIEGMFGEGGLKWLADLPRLINELVADRNLVVEKPFKNLSYHYVAPCTLSDGTEAVLKIGFPGEKLEFNNEVDTLLLYDGEGAVKLFSYDEKRFTMLLEKLTPGDGLGKLCLEEDEKAVEIAAVILKNIVRKVPSSTKFHLLENWINGLRRAKNTEFPAAAIKKAQDLYDGLTGKSKQKYLLHGDFHHENILSAERAPYLVIDPKGLIGDVGYDVGVFLNNHRNWLKGKSDISFRLDSAVGQFSEALDIGIDDVKKWAFIQMVLSAWWTFEENDERWKEDLSKAEIWQV